MLRTLPWPIPLFKTWSLPGLLLHYPYELATANHQVLIEIKLPVMWSLPLHRLHWAVVAEHNSCTLPGRIAS